MTFKTCTMCRVCWSTREAFLADAQVQLAGYQVSFEDLKAGLFLFNHKAAGCGTTLAVEADRFLDLYQGPVFETRLTGQDSCPGYCSRSDALGPCPAQCECRYVRDVLQVVKRWPKTARKGAA